MRIECPRCKLTFNSYGHCPQCGQLLMVTKSPSFSLPLTTIGYLALILIACLAVFSYFSVGKGLPPWFSFSLAKNSKASVDPPSFKVSGTTKPTLSVQDRQNIRDIFEKRQFNFLEKTAADIQLAFEQDPSYEYEASDFYGIFCSTLPEYETLLNEWVAHSPAHFAPYLARAEYYHCKGWESRGQRYATDTSEQQFSGMHSYFRKALQDIDAALVINPRLLSAYTLRISIYNADGGNNQKDAAFDKARQYFPSSFLLYNTMVWAKLPRWGGSYAEMDRLAMLAYKQIRINPELYMLFGRIYADQAWEFRQKKQYDKALALYAKAIKYGDYYEFYEERAKMYLEMKDYDQALEDVNQSISLRPVKPRPYCLRASIYLQKGDPDAAIRELRAMEYMFPGDFDIRGMKEWAVGWQLHQASNYFKKDLEQAVASYGRAIEIKPDCADAYYWRGMACWKLNKIDLARSDFEQAIKLNPHDMNNYRMMDYLLASQQKWDEIIEQWNAFLNLEPNNRDAYLERAGAYKHKGDMQNALADLKSACDRGNGKACGILKQYQ
jgi:tetratricopeptide (TPR) repeat protein